MRDPVTRSADAVQVQLDLHSGCGRTLGEPALPSGQSQHRLALRRPRRRGVEAGDSP